MKYTEQDFLILIYVLPLGTPNDRTIALCTPKIIVCRKRVTCCTALQDKLYLNGKAFLNLVSDW